MCPLEHAPALSQAAGSAVTEDASSSLSPEPASESGKRASHYLRLMHMYLWTFKEAPCRNADVVANHSVFYCPRRPFCNILWKFTSEEISNPAADRPARWCLPARGFIS